MIASTSVPGGECVTMLDGRVALYRGDCRDVVAGLPDASIDSVVCDPPYALVSIAKRYGKEGSAPSAGVYGRATSGFMGKQWDTGETAFAETFWREILRVLKPGGHVVSFAGTRTYHRLACAVEDAGFEIRDQIGYCYGTGFPKSHNVSKGIDREAGVERKTVGPKTGGRYDYPQQDIRGGRLIGGTNGGHVAMITEPATDEAAVWSGWGTALKPAWEPIVLARKPLIGTVAANVLAHGTGAINVDGCRVGEEQTVTKRNGNSGGNGAYGRDERVFERVNPPGRWPANVIHDGSEEVLAAFPESNHQTGGPSSKSIGGNGIYGGGAPVVPIGFDDKGSAARFFYSAKADADDRIGSKHPTVKPVDLMRYLCRLVTPPGGLILDPFAGTGTTGEAAFYEGFRAILIEREAEYQDDIERRMKLVMAGPEERSRESVKARHGDVDAGPLFGGTAEKVARFKSGDDRIGPIGMTKW